MITRRRHVRWITSTASPRRHDLMPFGFMTSSMSRDVDRLCLRPVVIDAMPAGSWAGEPRARRTPASCSMQWSRLCTFGGQSIAACSCSTARGAAQFAQYVPFRYTERPAESRRGALRRQCRRFLSQCLRRNHQRPLQGRGDPPARAMADAPSAEDRRRRWRRCGRW